MNETSETRETARARRPQRGRRIQLVFGVIYLMLAAFIALFALITWWVGRLNPINALVFALAFVGTTPWAIIVLRGDYRSSRSMDEGQREMYRAAMADAVNIAYFGLYALFMAYIFVPAWQAAAGIHVGVLLLLITATWFGGYLWRRRG